MPKLLDTLLLGSAKVAQAASGVEMPTQTQMEQDFGRMAVMFLQDRAPGLMPYMIGFEVVDQEPDGTKAIGIFGFKVGREYYYAPAFFINNQIKGVDLLFCKKTNMFLPLQEGWITYITNRQTFELGNADNSTANKTFDTPNYTILTRPPSGLWGKRAEDNTTPVSLAEAAVLMFNKMAEADAEFTEALTGLDAALTGGTAKYAEAADSDLRRFLSEAGPKATAAFLKSAGESLKFARATVKCYPSIAAIVPDGYVARAEKTAAKLEVVTKEWDNGSDHIVRRGFDIKDSRIPSTVGEILSGGIGGAFGNPTESGLYKVVCADKRLIPMWVVLDSAHECLLIPEALSKTTKLVPGVRKAHPQRVLVAEPRLGPIEDLRKQGVAAKDVDVGASYMIIGQLQGRTRVLGPFEVRSLLIRDGDIQAMTVNVPYEYRQSAEKPIYPLVKDFEGRYSGEHCFGNLDTKRIERIEFTDVQAVTQHTVVKDRQSLRVPRDWKFIKCSPTGDTWGGAPLSGSAANEKITYNQEQALNLSGVLGTDADITDSLLKAGMHNLEVMADKQGEFFLNFVDVNKISKPMNYKTAAVNLIALLGLPVKDSYALLDAAEKQGSVRKFVKRGQVSKLVGVNMPQPMDQIQDSDPYTGIPMYQTPYLQDTLGSFNGQPPPQDTLRPGVNLGGETSMSQGGSAQGGVEAEVDPNAQSVAQQAAAIGQKRVFDHASIGGLTKVYDTGAVIDSYGPEFLKSLDRLGRLLFLYYWNNKDFAERYGSNDLPQLEDTLRGVFKEFGDLVLQLRQKNITGDNASVVSDD